MEINTKGIYEIKCRGKDIIFTFKNEKDAWKSYKEQFDKATEFIKKNFPDGVIKDIQKGEQG